MSKDKPASPGPKKAGIPVAEAYAQHDKSTYIPKRIRDAIPLIGEGCFLREQEFMRLCNVKNPTDFAKYRDMFSDHWVDTKGRNPYRLWFCEKDEATNFRERIESL